jgi:hypothetical protein
MEMTIESAAQYYGTAKTIKELENQTKELKGRCEELKQQTKATKLTHVLLCQKESIAPKVRILYLKDTAQDIGRMVNFNEGLPVKYSLTIGGCSQKGQAMVKHNNTHQTYGGHSQKGQAMVKHNNTHTTMSVGDIVLINEKAFICQPIGWEELSFKILFDIFEGMIPV